jgi:hypothetical protein
MQGLEYQALKIAHLLPLLRPNFDVPGVTTLQGSPRKWN